MSSLDLSSLESVLGILAGAGIVVLLIALAFLAFGIVCQWKVFEKMGRPGWHALIPFFSSYSETAAVYGVGWWFLIPMATTVAGWLGLPGWMTAIISLAVLVYAIKYSMDMALCFGKHWAFGLLLAFIPFVGYAILAFGSDTYQGPRLEGPLNMSLQ